MVVATTPTAATTPSATASDSADPQANPTDTASPTPTSSKADSPPAAIRLVNSARGTFGVVTGSAKPDVGSGRSVYVSVEVEKGIPGDHAQFARQVLTILQGERGWQGVDRVRFVPVSAAKLTSGSRVDVRVTLASPTTTNRLCAPLNTGASKVSCWNGTRAVINLYRWVNGASTYGSNLSRYRTYLINHEVGHGLGHGHVSCPSSGARAPIMVQQTLSLQGCAPWPYPRR